MNTLTFSNLVITIISSIGNISNFIIEKFLTDQYINLMDGLL